MFSVNEPWKRNVALVANEWISCTYQGSHSDWKTWKNGKAFSSQGKVREFWTDWKSQGKVRENHTKYWKTEENWDKYYLIFLVIFKWTVHYLLKLIKFSVKKQNIKKILEKWQKILEKSGKSQGILSVRKSGNPAYMYLSSRKVEMCI